MNNTIELPADRNDEEFWMFFSEDDTHTRIVANIPERISQLPAFADAFNTAMRRTALFYGCRSYTKQTAHRVEGL